MMNMVRTDSVGIILYKDKSVLLVRHTDKARLPTGAYGFPAGRVEEGELSEVAAVRELEEETGFITTVDDLVALPERRSRIRMKEGYEYFSFKPFLCRCHSGEMRPSEKTIPEFVPLSRLDDIVLITKDVKEIALEGYAALNS